MCRLPCGRTGSVVCCLRSKSDQQARTSPRKLSMGFRMLGPGVYFYEHFSYLSYTIGSFWRRAAILLSDWSKNMTKVKKNRLIGQESHVNTFFRTCVSCGGLDCKQLEWILCGAKPWSADRSTGFRYKSLFSPARPKLIFAHSSH